MCQGVSLGKKKYARGLLERKMLGEDADKKNMPVGAGIDW